MKSISNSRMIKKVSLWRDERFLKAIAQAVSAIVLFGLAYWMVTNFLEITRQRGMSLSYEFMNEPAGFPISQSFIPYEPTMSFGRAFLVGLINTLLLSVTGITLATIIGLVVGLARLSKNWIVSRLAMAYIEFHRNIPLLVLLFLWYFAGFSTLPSVKQSITLPGPIYINQRGLYLTWPRLNETGDVFLMFTVLGFALSIIVWKTLRSFSERTGRVSYSLPVGLGVLLLLSAIGWFASGGSPFSIAVPILQGFNFRGGLRLTPEFAAMLIGLTMYTSAFIAEVIRAGIQAVQRGQIEAARALGLRNPQVLNLIVIPQAMRVIIPPLISQYLNLTKNSSLALAIGYQELFAVGRITINQAGRAMPVFLLIMAIYLFLSLITSLVLNIYNRRIQFVER